MSSRYAQNLALYVICPRCVSVSAVESRDDGYSVADAHNINEHDGKRIAATVNVREESGLRNTVHRINRYASEDDYRSFVRRLSNGTTEFFCSPRCIALSSQLKIASTEGTRQIPRSEAPSRRGTAVGGSEKRRSTSRSSPSESVVFTW